jgi:SAM-dependent methyltransferase
MDHTDHVELIRRGVDGAAGRWLELGSGDGAFTLALADLLGPGGHVLASDRDERALRAAERAVGRRFPDTIVEAQVVDYTDTIPGGPFDGVLAANTLHFVNARDRDPILRAIRSSLAPGGRLVIVEYDADRGNPWVPHPFSFETWRRVATAAGYAEPRLIGLVPSRFLGAIYAAVTTAAGPPSVPPEERGLTQYGEESGACEELEEPGGVLHSPTTA